MTYYRDVKEERIWQGTPYHQKKEEKETPTILWSLSKETEKNVYPSIS